MPIYEYVCTACNDRADILHGINDPAPNYCPSCGQEGTMRKQFAPPAIHYKGTGWARKDRGSASRGTKAASAASSSTGKADAAAGNGASATASGAGKATDPSTTGAGGD